MSPHGSSHGVGGKERLARVCAGAGVPPYLCWHGLSVVGAWTDVVPVCGVMVKIREGTVLEIVVVNIYKLQPLAVK